MPDPIPRGPFDEGLFLAHFNKGRELFDAGQHADAERELEEAYLLRPRDVRVLNLLGLVYFRQEKLERAEEVYRKLVAESPEAHTLHYNLGLICLKLSRLDDAELAFQKALELTPSNPKIHFYLGQIHERQHRYKDAIYQYRQAGANMMVRRVEGKLATTPTPAHSRPAVKARGERPDTTPPAPAARAVLDDDAASIVTAKVMVPVSPAILASPPRAEDPPEVAAGPKAGDLPAAADPPKLARPSKASDRGGTERFQGVKDDTLPPQGRLRKQLAQGTVPVAPPAEAPLPDDEARAAEPGLLTPTGTRPIRVPADQPGTSPGTSPGTRPGNSAGTHPGTDTSPGTQPGTRPPTDTARSALSATTPPEGTPAPGREVFRCVEKGLMEVDFAGKVFLKQGTIYSYSGNLTFWVKEKRPGGVPALVIVTGTGRLLLTDHERDITLMQVTGEPVFVEPAHLLACEEGLQPRYARIGDPDGGVDVVVLEGRGAVALSVASKPLPLTVRAGFPVSVPSRSVIMWTGQVEASVVEDPTVYEVVLPSEGGSRLLRLDGEGRVLVEQATG